MSLVFLFIFLMVLGYAMGSISSAIIVCRMFNLPDPRAEGSKNPGATNVLRIAGKQYAALVMVGDILKGTLPVVIAKLLGADSTAVGFTALAAVVGHMYPIFFQFKGGKGVATAIGALLGLQFLVGVMAIATWLLVVNFTRYSSLASIVTITLSPFYALFITHRMDVFLPLSIIVILVLFKHRNNITRLLDGVEPKVTLKKSNVIEQMEPLAENPPVPAVVAEDVPVTVKDAPPLVKTVAKKRVKQANPASKIAKTKTTNTKEKPIRKKSKPKSPND